MRSGLVFPASLLAAALAMAVSSPARADIVVNIDKTTQRMTVAVDGTPRYDWPVSTGRAGYDTPNGTFKINRMDADHLSQEWDNAPMPHSMFFDMRGHAIHGFFDVKHLGLPVSHGCVRISPDHAAELYKLVEAEGMKETKVIVSGQTPSPALARRNLDMTQPHGAVAAYNAPPQPQPMDIAPRYDQRQPPPQQPQPYGQQSYYQRQPQQPPAYDGQPPQQYYGQPQPSSMPPQPPPPRQSFFGSPAQPPAYDPQRQQQYYGQAQQPYPAQQQPPQAYYQQAPQPYYQQQSYYGQPVYVVPQQQYYVVRPQY
jgi:hypothetical protein